MSALLALLSPERRQKRWAGIVLLWPHQAERVARSLQKEEAALESSAKFLMSLSRAQITVTFVFYVGTNGSFQRIRKPRAIVIFSLL